MASPKYLQLVSNENLGDESYLLTLESEADIGFRGGQFLIVDTGLRKDDGSPLKRCYSILSSSDQQRRIELAIRRIGPGSTALEGFEPNATVAYSGPWGKLLASAQAEDGPALVVATDTGITAALGLVAGEEFAPRRSETTLIWFDHEPHALITEADAKRRAPESLGCFERREIPAVDDESRIEATLEALDDALERAGADSPNAIWLVGDGVTLYAIRERLASRYGAELASAASIECFFNNPERART